MAAALRELAELIDGVVVDSADGARLVRGVGDLAHAGPGELSFFTQARYLPQLLQTRAEAVLLRRPEPGAPCAQLLCRDPYLALARISAHLHREPRAPAGIHPSATLAPEAQVDPSASIGPQAVVAAGAVIAARVQVGAGCYVGPQVHIGADSLLHPQVRLMRRTQVGARNILHPGAVIGSDGFGFAVDTETGVRHKIPQLGHVVLEDDVEIGANSCVDCATFGVTRIGAGTKIDNLVQVGHNVQTGRDCVLVSQSGIAGSTRLGDRVIVGAQGGMAGHVQVADDVILGGRTGVTGSIRQAGVYSGLPAMPHRTWLRVLGSQQSLPELRRRVRALEAQLQGRDGAP